MARPKGPRFDGGSDLQFCTRIPRFVSILSELEQRAADHGAETAYRFIPDSVRGSDLSGAAVWNWAEVWARSRAAAAEIEAQTGLQPGDRLLLTYPSGLEFIVAFLGCFLAGLVPVPVSAPRRKDGARWLHIYRDAGAKASLAARSIHGQMADLSSQAGLGPCLALTAADPDRPCPAPDRRVAAPQPGPDTVAFLQYTSGSTDQPKGVIVTYGMIHSNLVQIIVSLAYRPGDHLLSWLPMYHDMGLITSVLLPIKMQFETTVISPAAFMRDPMRFLALVSDLGASGFGGPNFSFDQILAKATPEAIRALDLSGVRVVFSGAEAIRADTMQAFAESFAPAGLNRSALTGCYGMAEATLCAAFSPAGEEMRGLTVAESAFRAGQLVAGSDRPLMESGAPVLEAELAIVDPARLQRVGPGQIGEIWIRGAQVSPGYWNRPDLNAAQFDQPLEGGAGWLRSGDLGAQFDGRLYVTGRIKEMIIIRGQNHYPQDIEATLAAAHGGLQPGRIAAFALDEGEDGAFGLACELTRSAARSPDQEGIFAAMRHALAQGHGLAPGRILLLRPGALPITPSGKIQRSACPGLQEGVLAVWSEAADLPALPKAPRGGLAAELCAMPAALRRDALLRAVREHLATALKHHDPVPQEARFFDLGLDSASAAALVAQLEQALDLPLDTTVIYEFPTLGGLVGHMLDRLGARLGPEPPPQPEPDDITALKALLAAPARP